MIFYVHKTLSVTDFQPFLYIKKHNLLLLDHLTSCTPTRSRSVATVSGNAVLQTSLTLKYCRQTTKEPGLPFRPSLADIHQLSLPSYLWNAWTNDKNETQVFTTVIIITIFWYVRDSVQFGRYAPLRWSLLPPSSESKILVFLPWLQHIPPNSWYACATPQMWLRTTEISYKLPMQPLFPHRFRQSHISALNI